jgi:Protein of unknown function, DUF488
MPGANSKAHSQTWRSHSSPLAIPRAGEFIDLLVASKVGLVVDGRTIPRSRTNPQYNREALPGSLSGFQIAYEHVAELGGRRARAKNIAPEVNAFWENQSFHNYADYAMGGGFRSGLARLRELGAVPREKAQAAPTARPKVPMRRRGADCPVVVLKRGNARGAKGAGHRR